MTREIRRTQQDFVDHIAWQLSDCEGNLDCLQKVQTKLLSEEHQPLAQFERGTFSRALNLADSVLGAEKYLQQSGLPALQPAENSADYFVRSLSEVILSHSYVPEQVYRESAYRQLEKEAALRQADKTVAFMKERRMTPYGPNDNEQTVEDFYEQIADDNGKDQFISSNNLFVTEVSKGVFIVIMLGALCMFLSAAASRSPPVSLSSIVGGLVGAALLGGVIGYVNYHRTSTPQSQLENAAWSVVSK